MVKIWLRNSDPYGPLFSVTYLQQLLSKAKNLFATNCSSTSLFHLGSGHCCFGPRVARTSRSDLDAVRFKQKGLRQQSIGWTNGLRQIFTQFLSISKVRQRGYNFKVKANLFLGRNLLKIGVKKRQMICILFKIVSKCLCTIKSLI